MHEIKKKQPIKVQVYKKPTKHSYMLLVIGHTSLLVKGKRKYVLIMKYHKRFELVNINTWNFIMMSVVSNNKHKHELKINIFFNLFSF